MRWQRAAQVVIAVLVAGFVVVLVMTLRKERVEPQKTPPPKRLEPNSTLESQGGGSNTFSDPSGKKRFVIAWGTHVALPDGRSRLSKVEVTINRGERPLVITADEADVTQKEGSVEPEQAVFKGNVRLSGGSGLDVAASEATYTKTDGMLVIPGPVTFTKGRMRGSGVGATYDQNREVLWILDQAKIAVAAGKDGQGSLDATAAKAGLARAEHYMVLEGAARIDAQGRIIQADQITLRLTPDDERIRVMELRGQSRITGGGGGPQAMSATDIDLTYGEDGRTLQFAKLAHNAVLQMPGGGGGAGKRIAGDAIDLTLAPDGSTVTNLAASGRVQVDLPAEADAPAQQIRSASLTAVGTPETGLQNATFGGGVDYRETRAAQKGAAAVDRTAKSQSLILDTKPGLGALQKADFRGNVQFRDSPDFRAEAQQGVYHIAGDRLALMPAEGQPGPVSPRVSDGKISVAARRIHFTLSNREMTADGNVRSTILPQKAEATAEARIPSMLAQDKEVNVTADKLHYKGAGATYTGNVTLWQEKTQIKGAEIVIDEKNGNLTASGGATTFFLLEETDAKTGTKRIVESTGKADTFTYTDAKRLATYTGQAQINGPQGNVVGDRILLFLEPKVNELERAEAYGTNGSVVVKEGHRIAKGDHLTYTAADQTYLMTGTPVELVEEKDGSCSFTHGADLAFSRVGDSARVNGNGTFPHTTRTQPCPPGLGK